MQDNHTFCHGNTPEETQAMESYFDSLSPYIQENIRQSGVNFCNVKELQSCAENIMRIQ